MANHLSGAHIEIEHTEELAIAAGIGDQRLPAVIADERRRRHTIVGVTTENGVQPAHARGQFQIHIHAVVRQQHHHLRTLATGLIDHRLQVFFLDAEAPVRNQMGWIGNRRVRKSLTDDRHRHAATLADHIRLEDGIAEVTGFHVVGNEVHLAGEILIDDLLHALGAERELPVSGHDVDTQQFAGIHHVLAARPQCRGRTLPGITAVQQQRTRARGPQLFDQRGQMGEATDPPIASSGLDEVERGEGVRRRGVGLQAELFQKGLAHQMRRPVQRLTQTQVDRGLAEMDGQQLGVAVGEVQQMHIAAARRLVEPGKTPIRTHPPAARQAAGNGGRCQHLQEFAALHHGAAPLWLTGDCGSNR